MIVCSSLGVDLRRLDKGRADPRAYRKIVVEAVEQGVIGDEPDAYVIPMLREQRLKGERDDRVIWRILKSLGERAGLDPDAVVPHSLRHAF